MGNYQYWTMWSEEGLVSHTGKMLLDKLQSLMLVLTYCLEHNNRQL